MDRPKKIKVGFRDFKINYNPGWDALKGDIYGDITFHTKEIRVNDTIDEDEKKVVVLHEMLHALARLRGDDLKEDSNEEVIAVSLSELLFTTIKQNKEVFKWIIS